MLRYLVSEVQLPVRAQSGPSKGELEWRRPTRETLQNLLHNPAYAGYYAYGRRQVDPRRKIAGRPDTGKVVKDSSEWLVLLPGRLPAYITPEEYEANVARMAADRQTAEAPGAPRDGAALLSGLLRCGRCGGHRMSVSYHDGSRARAPPTATRAPSTRSITGPAAGASTSPAPPSTTRSPAGCWRRWPAALEVSMAAAAQAEDERAMLGKLWRQRLERAGYAADRARRQYQLAEPENRLVARQLEADWRAALAEAARLEADYQRFTEEQPAVLSAAERAAIQALGGDLPRVWHAPSTTQADRKELLRILIEDITVNVAGDSELVDSPSPGPAATRPPGRPSAPSAAWTSSPTSPRSSPASPNSPSRPEQPADRRCPQRGGIPPAQAHQPVHPPASPHPDQPARHPRPGQGQARRPHRTRTRRVVGPRPVRRAGHAHRQYLQLDLPRLDHRPPRPRQQELDHHCRRRATPPATRTQSPPARLLHPCPLGTARQTRRATRNTTMRKQRSLTGASGGRLRRASAAPPP